MGDSLTRGNNDINYPNGDIPGGYRKELARKLASGGFSFDFVGTCSDNATAGVDPQHDGHPGYRTDEILANLPSYLSVAPDTVLLMVGTNDILQAKSVEVAAANLNTIIERITANTPRRRLYVCTITPITQNWFGQSAGMLNAKVDAYNTDVRNIVQAKRNTGQNVFLMDMRNLIVLMGSSPAENFFQSGDGLHPGQAGYNQMGRIWFDAITTTGALLDVPASSYENWTGNFPDFMALPESDRLASADPNKDGWTNLMAYALCVAPLSQVPVEAMPHIEIVQGTNPPEFVFRFRRHLASSDLEYDVLSAAEPGSRDWSMLPLDNARLSAVAGNQLMEEVSVPVPSSAGTAHFFRLRVVKSDSSE